MVIDVQKGGRYRHVKRRSIYTVIDFVTIEKDKVPAVLYKDAYLEGAVPWVRPLEEFADGRFEPVGDEEDKTWS